MNKEDWKEYVEYLRDEIKVEGAKSDKSSRDVIIKSINLNELYADLNDSKRRSLI